MTALTMNSAVAAFGGGCLFMAGCVLFTGGPPTAPVFEPPATQKVYANAASYEDQKCHQSGACDAFKLGWAPKTSVRIVLDAPEHATWMTVSCPGATEVRVETEPGKPGKVELVRTEKTGLCSILVSARKYDTEGEYTLTVGAPPLEENALPRPPISLEVRRAEVLGQRPAQPAFSMTDRERDTALKPQLKQYERMGEPISTRLDEFVAVPVTGERGFCYYASWQLGAGAGWSELAQRGISWVVQGQDGRSSTNSRVLGTGGLVGAVCPKTAGAFSLLVRAEQGPQRLRGEVGKGPITFQLHRQAIWPGSKSAADSKRSSQSGHAVRAWS